MTTPYYKLLNTGRVSPIQNHQWPKPGVWTPEIKSLVACESGYHLLRAAPHTDIFDWTSDELWLCEKKGRVLKAENKVVVKRARLVKKLDTWNERTFRLFACDCVERQIGCWYKVFPCDKRIAQVLEVCRRYARGEATKKELNAARNAASVAAWGAEKKRQAARLWQYINGEVK